MAEVPALGPLLSEHLDDMDGELLAHLLFYDFTMWAQAQPLDSEALSRFLAVLEDAYAGQDMDQRNVIYVSFWRTSTLPRPSSTCSGSVSPGTPGTSGPGRRSQVSELRSSGTSIALRCRASRGTTATALSCVLASTTGAGTPSS